MTRIVAFTGAGISAESGIPTFRGKGGLWEKFKPEELATPEAFMRNPELVWRWYDERRQMIKKAKPNEGHLILAKIEEEADYFVLITQNVDGLHFEAGNRNVLELHGNIWRVRCLSCGQRYYLYETPLKEIPPRCQFCGGLLRPDVVWFGEMLDPDILDRAFRESELADVFIVVGTSAVVYPAAYLPVVAKEHGAFLIEVNPEETPISEIADVVIREKAGTGMKRVYEILRERGDI